jgi:arylsulfatase A-like enzyme
MQPDPQRRTDPRALLVRAALVALPLVVVRAAFRAVKDQHLERGLHALFARSLARDLLEGLAWAALPALALCLLVAAQGRRRLALGVLLLAAAGLAFAFVAMRLPADPFYAPGTRTTAGKLALVASAAAALLAVLPALPAVRVPRAGALALAAPVLALVAGAVLLWPAGARAGRPNLILISLDTLRRDHVGCYGYERDTTPALDALAARSLRFDNAFSVQPWTLTAHMTMLTGLLPSVHGLSTESGLPRGIPTLADLLKPAGYVTLGVADQIAYFEPRFGYARGFDVYEQLIDRADRKVDRIVDLVDDAGGRPFFLFAHFYDAHSDWNRLPYEAAPDDQAALAPWYAGDADAWCTPEGLCGSKMLLDLYERDAKLAGEELARLIDLYDAGVRSLDREIGRLIDALERRGRMEDTVILITADHGEEFFDHGKPLHGRCFDECLNVPFLLYVPPSIRARGAGSAGGSTGALASLVDVPATFLDLAGLPPPDVHQGVSLAPLARGEELERERDAVVIEQIGGLRGLRGKRWSLVPHGSKRLLFDVANDPGQTVDLVGPEHADVLGEMRARLEAEEAAADVLRARFASEAVDVELSDQERALLRNLGYAGD